MSLRYRLNLAIALSMFLIVAAGTLFTIYKARQSVEQEVKSSVNLALQSVETGLAESASAGDLVAYWQTRLGIQEKTRHLRVRIESTAGTAIDLPRTAVPVYTPSAPGWFTWWVRPEPRVQSRRIETPQGPITITLSDDPNDEIAEAWGEARGFFGLIILQALLVFALVHVTLGRALRSVPVILKGFEGLESGNYRERLPDFSLPEFARISKAFNHAASALQKADAENRALARRTLTVQEEERRILAQELHDELGQSLTGIKVIAASVSKETPSNRSAVDSIAAICDHLFSVVRSMMRRLRPTMLDDLGLAASLEDMIGNWEEQNRTVKVGLRFEDAVEKCGGATKIHLFRIVQESLSNVARHAGASRVEIQLETLDKNRAAADGNDPDRCPEWVKLNIADDGRGFGPNDVQRGFGLLGIRERAESLGGVFRLHTQPGEGVSVSVEVPCKESDR